MKGPRTTNYLRATFIKSVTAALNGRRHSLSSELVYTDKHDYAEKKKNVVFIPWNFQISRVCRYRSIYCWTVAIQREHHVETVDHLGFHEERFLSANTPNKMYFPLNIHSEGNENIGLYLVSTWINFLESNWQLLLATARSTVNFFFVRRFWRVWVNSDWLCLGERLIASRYPSNFESPRACYSRWDKKHTNASLLQRTTRIMGNASVFAFCPPRNANANTGSRTCCFMFSKRRLSSPGGCVISKISNELGVNSA